MSTTTSNTTTTIRRADVRRALRAAGAQAVWEGFDRDWPVWTLPDGEVIHEGGNDWRTERYHHWRLGGRMMRMDGVVRALRAKGIICRAEACRREGAL